MTYAGLPLGESRTIAELCSVEATAQSHLIPTQPVCLGSPRSCSTTLQKPAPPHQPQGQSEARQRQVRPALRRGHRLHRRRGR